MFFDLTGKIPKFKVNRPLTDAEREQYLDPKTRLDEQPHHGLCTIKLNSTFLESVSKYYESRGTIAFGVLFAIVLFAIVIVGLLIIMIGRWGSHSTPGDVIFLCFISALYGGTVLILTWVARFELFSYTHWPIRLNRKNRMVYVFRRPKDGGVLCVPWDDVFFHIGRGRSFCWDIRGHVMDTDGVTVRDTFVFGAVVDDEAKLHKLRSHWEFLRRYMEEPIETFVPSLDPPIEFCLPIADKKETFKFGWKRLWLIFHGEPWNQIIMSPIIVITGIGRYVSMLTSRIPQWPPDVEAECGIDADDPYVFDERINPAA